MQTQIRLPEGWEVRKLGEICLINPPKKEIGNLPDDLEVSFVPMSFVDDSEGAIKKQEIRKLAEVKKGYTYFKENDVLFAKITPCMENGKAAIAKNVKNGIGFGSTEFHVIRASEKALSEFIFYYIRQPFFRGEAESKMSGTAGQLRVPKSFLEDYEIPLPSIEIQQKIVARLDAFFEHYNELKKEKQKAKEKYEQIMQSAIASLIPQKELPDGWKYKKLEELSIKITDGEHITPKKVKKGIPILSAKNVREDYLDFDNADYVSEEDHFKFIKRCNPQKNDILMVSRGATIGRLYLMEEDKRFCLMGSVILIKPNTEQIVPQYLKCTLKARYTQDQLFKISGSTAQQAIYLTHIKNLNIPLSPIKIQKQLAKKLTEIEKKNKLLHQEQKNIDFQLEQLPKAVLSKAFRGELVS